MGFKQIFVRFTFILMTCSSFGLAQRSESASAYAVGGQVVLSGLKKQVLVLLDHSGSKKDQRTFTDLRGNFEFRNVPKGRAWAWPGTRRQGNLIDSGRLWNPQRSDG